MSKLLNAAHELHEWLQEHNLLRDVEGVTIKMKGHNLSFYAGDCLRHELTPNTIDDVKYHSYDTRVCEIMGIPFKFEGERRLAEVLGLPKSK